MSNKSFEYYSAPQFATEELNVLASGKWVFGNSEPRVLTFGWLSPTTYRYLWGDEKTSSFNEAQKQFVRNQFAFLSSILNITFIETNDQADLRFGITTQTKENSGAYAYQSVTSDVGGGYHRDVLMVADSADPNRLIFDASISSNGVNGLVHEIDHALGIKHITEGQTIVSDSLLEKWYTGTNTAIYSGSRNTFGINDIEYFWTVYGKNLKPFHTNDDVYTPISGRYDLIYDTGGSDSLVIKGLTNSYSPDRVDPITKKVETYHYVREININPSSYSTIFRLNDLYILENTLIEKVYDSSENSIIRGNQVSNFIDASLGSDTVFGADGDDTIFGGPEPSALPREMTLVKFNDKYNGDGYKDTYLLTNKKITLPSNSIKIEMVVGLNEMPNGWQNTLIGYSGGGEWDDRQFNVYIGSDYLRMWVAGDLFVSKVFTPNLLLGDPKRLTFSWESASGALGIYLNGQLIDSGVVAKDKALSAGNFWIASFWDNIFKGSIGDIAIWSQAVSSYDEKTSLLADYTSLLSDSNLKYLWTANNLSTLITKTPEFINLKDPSLNLSLANTNAIISSNVYKISTSTLLDNDNDVVDGGNGNDIISGGGGNDTIDGGSGLDTAIYGAQISKYAISHSGAVFTVSSSFDGVDVLTNVERLKFTDLSMALDLAANQSAGQSALLLGAVLPGKLALDASKQALLGSVISLFDSGLSMSTLAGALLRLDIWSILTSQAIPAASRTLAQDSAIVNYLMTNVNGVAPDSAVLKSNADVMHNEASQGTWLAQLALSSAGQTHIGLVGLAATGLTYV